MFTLKRSVALHVAAIAQVTYPRKRFTPNAEIRLVRQPSTRPRPGVKWQVEGRISRPADKLRLQRFALEAVLKSKSFRVFNG